MSMQPRAASKNADQENTTTTINAAVEQTIREQIEAILNQEDTKNKAESIQTLCNEHIKNKNDTKEVKAAFKAITQEKADAWAELLANDIPSEDKKNLKDSIKEVFKPFYVKGDSGDNDEGKEPYKYFFLAALGFFKYLPTQS